MGQDQAPGAAATISRCPWCSAELSGGRAASCPSCGAALVEPNSAVPGVNALDAEAISRAVRMSTPIKRSRLVAWITGDDDSDDETPAPPGSLELPAPEVRREMARLAFQAEYANLEAEAGSIVSEAEAEARAAGRSTAQPAPVPASESSETPETPEPAADDTEARNQPD
jgi:hypothetical protein